MNTDRNALDIEQLFHSAAEILDPQVRAAYLDQACQGDEKLRRDVEELLQHDAEVGGILRLSRGSTSVDETTDSVMAERRTRLGGGMEKTGTRIGPYELAEIIGEGGMGTVWVAEQYEPIRRTVALKLIKPGMDSKQVVSRFEIERQALAVMDHPHIARVLDAGVTTSGRPFFVMELVNGIPITRYADERQLTIDERVALMIPVCHAIQHAHYKGVLHRDIKATNVLVATYDGRPVPKVIDFGIAKAIAQPLEQTTAMTGIGGIVGTFEYMSPEQAEFSSVDVDTRSDVYSLGVLLYELLTGTTPMTRERLQQASVLEVLRSIREEDPPTPSLLMARNRSLQLLSQQRRVSPSRLPNLLRGELDWIVMRALEKDRQRRYATPIALAIDIQRYLSAEPVEACAPTVWYRARKFIIKHWATVAAGASISLALILSTAISIRSAIVQAQARKQADDALAREGVARQEAENRNNELQKVTAFQSQLLTDIDVKSMGTALRDVIVTQASTPSAISRESSEQLTARMTSLHDSLDRVNFTDVALSSIHESILNKALKTIESEYQHQPLLQAQLRESVASTLWGLGLHNAAVEPQRQVIAVRRKWLGLEHPLTLESMTWLATILQARGELQEAEPLLREVLEIRQRKLGLDDHGTLHTMQELGWNLGKQGKLDEAFDMLSVVLSRRRRLLGNENSHTFTVMGYTAELAEARGDKELAEKLDRELLEIATKSFGAESEAACYAAYTLGGLLARAGNLDEAELLMRFAVHGYRQQKGNSFIHTLTAVASLAKLLNTKGNLAEAEQLAFEALEGRKASLGADHPHTVISVIDVTNLLVEQGRLNEAESVLLSSCEELGLKDEMRRSSGDQAGAKVILQRLISFYTTNNNAGQAAHWQQRLEALQISP